VQKLEDYKIQKISTGCDHSFIITETGEVFGWGFGQHGTIGYLLQNYETPTLVTFPGSVKEIFNGMDVVHILTEIPQKFVH